MKQSGMVYLVGAGPGDVGLLTLRGEELLKRAHVVVYDALINQDMLRLAPESAEVIYAGKRPKQHAMPQEELNAILIKKAREGKRVIRLKGGDPYLFGRGGEEAEVLAEAGIPFEVVPGVSSFVAAPNYAGIPLTHRDHSSVVTIITGHEDPARSGDSINYDQLARMPGTKVILMGVQQIGRIAEELQARGVAPDLPVAMVHWGTTGRQQTLTGTLKTIAAQVASHDFQAPAVIVLGEVVGLRDRLNWFETRPLFGQRIVVTRSSHQISRFTHQLRELGADVLEIPTIKMVAPDNKAAVVDALLGLNSYDWIIFTSPNGVTAFFDYFFKTFEDLRDIGGVHIAAVGPGTAAKLKELHLKVDVIPDKSLATEIPAALTTYESLENRNILLMRAQEANPELPKALEALGAIVDDIACYKTVPETEDPTGGAARFLAGGADWITFTSGSTVTNFHARFDLPKITRQFPELKLASIGPETSKAITALDLKPTLEAKTHSIEGLIQALLKWG